MKFLFCNLPLDVIKYILLFDDHYIMRKGEMVAIIPKKDYRYHLLRYITFRRDFIENYNNMTICHYYFPNVYQYSGRRMNNSDVIQMIMQEESDGSIRYRIWIGRQYPKSFICSKRQDYYIENPAKYHWVYTETEYVRR
jgi:hypothetical protein